MTETDPFIFFSILVGVVAFLFAFKRMHEYRLIQDTPRSKIRSMAMGVVEIHGIVMANECMKTLFSQKECVYYRYKVDEYKWTTDSRGQPSRKWVNVVSGQRKIPFFAKDETGVAYVNPNGAYFDVPVKNVFIKKADFLGKIRRTENAKKDWNAIIKNQINDWDKNGQKTVMSLSDWNLKPINPKNGDQ